MTYKFIDTTEELTELVEKIYQYKGIVGLDTETTGLDWMLNKILLCQIEMGGEIFIVDVRKLGYKSFGWLVSTLEESNNLLILHNAKFDIKFIHYATKVLLTNVFDTMITESILTAGFNNKFSSLGTLVEKYTDYFMDKTDRKEFIDYPDDKPFTEVMLQYSALDVKVLPEIYAAQVAELEKSFQTDVANVDNRLIPVVAKMEIDGIRLDVDAWLKVEGVAVEKRNALSNQLKEVIADFAVKMKVANGLELAEKLAIPVKGKARRKSLEDITDISLMRGWLMDNFNPKSPLQMWTILNLMGVKVKDTNEKTLEKYKGKNDFIDLLLLIREVNKQIDSYGRNVIEQIHPVTGKLHTDYSTVGTRTGRFSSKNPNLQNVPTHGGYRECFLPDPDFVFCAIDYSQQEYRLAGAVSGEPVIIDAYQKGKDMHTATAANFTKKSLDEVTKDERSWGKTRNFEIIYGTTEWGLSKSLKCSMEEATAVLAQYWAGYPVLHKFKEQVEAKIIEFGFSSTPLGRRRYNAPKPVFMNTNELARWRSMVLREGFNHIIQGGGADIIKLAMVEIFHRNPYGEMLRLCLQIHDELLVQLHKDIKEEGAIFVKNIMEETEQRFLGAIPAKVDGWTEFKDRWSK